VPDTDDATPTDAPDRGFAEVGERVASILTAAESAAAEIRGEAERHAEALRRDADAEVKAKTSEARERAVSEADRLVSAAEADAAAIRDATRAAARRIAEEGQRRLGELRRDARALEGRFESAVDDLRDLVAQLESVVQNAVQHEEPQRNGAAADLAEDLRPAARDDAPVAAPAAADEPAPHES
jgi:vacuolar-type H+-ATPase subunit H